MYEKFFGFRERPFELTTNPDYLVLTPSHEEALSTLQYALTGRSGMTLMVGEAGSGKTTLIRAALQRQPRSVHAIHIHNPTLTRAEFVQTLAGHFGLSVDAAASKAVLLTELEPLLRRRREQGETTVLVVDEGQSLPLELLEEVRLLLNLETNQEKLLTVILAGQPEVAARLNEHELRQLKQRIALRCELRTLTLPETAAYLAGRIQAAGGVGAQVFTREAVGAIYEHSRGIPRVINVIADNALLGSFAAGQRPVTSRVVREVCADFQIGDVAPAPAQAPVSTPAPPQEAAPADQPPQPDVHGRILFSDRSTMGRLGEAEGEAPAQRQATATKRRRFSFFRN